MLEYSTEEELYEILRKRASSLELGNLVPFKINDNEFCFLAKILDKGEEQVLFIRNLSIEEYEKISPYFLDKEVDFKSGDWIRL